MTEITGYIYGQTSASRVSLDDLKDLEETLLWTDEDTAALRLAGEVLEDQINDVLDLWYGYVGSHPHLVKYFSGPDGAPSAEYLDGVRARFGQWIRDLCGRTWDTDWLAYQDEIAVRHTTAKKGATDGIDTSEPYVPLRYMVAFIWPITATIKDFLAKKGHGADDVERMYQAWFKAVTLSVTLWARPYAPETW